MFGEIDEFNSNIELTMSFHFSKWWLQKVIKNKHMQPKKGERR